MKNNSVDVWLIDLEQEVPNVVLSLEELQKANAFVYDIHRNRFLACRRAVKKILSRYIHIDANELAFIYNAYGKPSLPYKNICFNWSHAHNKALLACAKHDVGVDIERINPEQLAASEVACHHYEKEVLKYSTKPVEDFFQFWVRKEALLKADGTGLSIAPDSVSTVAQSGELLDTIILAGKSWQITLVKLKANYAAALATETKVEINYLNANDYF